MPRRPTILALVLAAAALSAHAQETAPPNTAPLTLAILRRDGVLIQFATWSGKAWGNTWPVPKKHAETPITLDELPKRWWGKAAPPATWHAWTRDGRQAALHPTTPTWYLAHCQQGTGIRTDFAAASPAPPPVEQPYPKDGVAASAAVAFQPIGVLSQTSPVWKALSQALPARVTVEEDRVIKRYVSAGWTHPYTHGRDTFPVTVEALYRMPTDGGQFLHYFEAVKRYGRRRPKGWTEPPWRDPDCDLVTFIAGWFPAGNGDTAVTLGEIRIVLTTCDFADADVMLPLASLTWQGKPHWIVQYSGWGRESYELLQVAPGALPARILQTQGGSCPRVGG
jgi:hypothetical protein